ncbi:MAG: N-formylglutamate amidohydrolase [Acetobacteraceae bacterium]
MSFDFVPVAAAAAPFSILPAAEPEGAVVLVSAHSGRAYPPEFVAAAALDARSLRLSEDGFVDELFATAPAAGAAMLRAHFPRAWCDANREPFELDPAMFEDALPPHANTASPRVAAGLGTIARVVASGQPIYRRKLRYAEAEARLRSCWRPFHAALAALIGERLQRLGACLVLDCHSMPADGGGNGAEVVLGDLHGTSCARAITAAAERLAGAAGFTVRRNDPYAGGYITRAYGRPQGGVHVLQLEIARRLYMDERRIEKLPGFDTIAARIGEMTRALVGAAPRLLGLD